MVHKVVTRDHVMKGSRSALKLKPNAEKPSMRVEGFTLTVEYWHAKQTLFDLFTTVI